MALLLERDVCGGVADEHHRQQERDHGDARGRRDEHVAGGELGRQPAADRGGERDAAVAGRLIEPEREAAPLGPDEVDLHDHGHRPRQALVDTEQDVGGDDPAPARRDGDQQRDGQRDRPAGDQQTPAAEPLREYAGAEVGERLREAEGDDERQHRGLGGEPEVGLADERQGRALEPDHRADEGVDRDEQRELREVLAQSEFDPALAHRLALSGRPARFAATISAWRSGAGGMSSSSAGDERLLAVEAQRAVVAALEADGRDRVGRQPAPAHRPRVVRGIEGEVVGQGHEPLGQRAIQRAGHLLDAVLAVSVEVRSAGVADEQRVAGEHEPRLVAAGAIGDEIGVMGERVAGRGQRLHLGVTEHDDFAVGQRVMGELDAGALRQVRRGARALDELGQPGDVVGLQVRLEHRDDRHALALGELDVRVDEVDVRIDDREGRLDLQPNRYDAQAVSSLSSWRKYMTSGA